MRLITRVVCLALVLGVPALAQDTPKAEVFGGYSYFRDSSFDFNFFGPPAPRNRNFHGWNTSVAGNVNRWFGVVADFGGIYGSSTPGGPSAGLYTFTFGPQFSYRAKRVTPFGRILFGGTHSSQMLPSTQFAGHIGVGLDWKVTDRIAARFATDALIAFPAAGTRYSFGVVFKLGKK